MLDEQWVPFYNTPRNPFDMFLIFTYLRTVHLSPYHNQTCVVYMIYHLPKIFMIHSHFLSHAWPSRPMTEILESRRTNFSGQTKMDLYIELFFVDG